MVERGGAGDNKTKILRTAAACPMAD